MLLNFFLIFLKARKNIFALNNCDIIPAFSLAFLSENQNLSDLKRLISGKCHFEPDMERHFLMNSSFYD